MRVMHDDDFTICDWCGGQFDKTDMIGDYCYDCHESDDGPYGDEQ